LFGFWGLVGFVFLFLVGLFGVIGAFCAVGIRDEIGFDDLNIAYFLFSLKYPLWITFN